MNISYGEYIEDFSEIEEIPELTEEFNPDRLADFVYQFIMQDFGAIYKSGNLRDTTQLSGNQIFIPAVVYNSLTWRLKRIIVYEYEKGSYANLVNEYTGGYSGKHKHFVENSIKNATAILADLVGCEYTIEEYSNRSQRWVKMK